MNTTVLNNTLLAIGVLFLLVGCSKDPSSITAPPKPIIETRTDAQKLLDSIYFQYKYLSLWESSIETTNPISTLTDKYTDKNALLNYLKKQTPQKTDYVFHPDYDGPLDRFSWLEDLATGSSSARADLADGYGIFLTFDMSRGDSLFVYFVEGGSPGFKSGVKRGDKIVQINQDKNMVYANRFNIESYLDGSKMDIITVDADNLKKTHSLTYTSYDIDPVMKDTLYRVNSKNVGYLALSSFEELTNDAGSRTAMYNKLEKIFANFATKNITDLIVDLRYNTGGYVSTAVYLNNKIINNSGNGKLMFSYTLNKNLEKERQQGSREFSPENYKKNNSTDIKNVYFLVSDMTASASEIVISALKPYMNVNVVAEYQSTYGKPVGFFRQDIMDKVGLWAASFKIVNASGYTDYWDGIPANKSNVLDNIYLELGNPKENMIQEALMHISSGSFTSDRSSARASMESTQTIYKNRKTVNKIPVRNLLKD